MIVAIRSQPLIATQIRIFGRTLLRVCRYINFSYLLDVLSSQCARNDGLQAAHAFVGSSYRFQRMIPAFFTIGVASEDKYQGSSSSTTFLTVTCSRDVLTQAVCGRNLPCGDSLLKYAAM